MLVLAEGNCWVDAKAASIEAQAELIDAGSPLLAAATEPA